MSAESLCKRDQQWRVAIAARAMHQDQCIAARIMRRVHPPAYVRINTLIED